MATEDGYFLGRQLAGVDLSDYAAVRAALDAFETPRKPHTARQVQQAFILGKVFHHAPAPLRVMRDAILDRTPLLQKVVGESSPGRSSPSSPPSTRRKPGSRHCAPRPRRGAVGPSIVSGRTAPSGLTSRTAVDYRMGQSALATARPPERRVRTRWSEAVRIGFFVAVAPRTPDPFF
jgi:hypothetical protein